MDSVQEPPPQNGNFHDFFFLNLPLGQMICEGGPNGMIAVRVKTIKVTARVQKKTMKIGKTKLDFDTLHSVYWDITLSNLATKMTWYERALYL